jgi:hypothetical protein
MTKNLLLDATILLGLVLLGAVAHELAPLLSPRTDIRLPLSTCRLAERPCAATLPDGGRIEFSIEPRPIPVLAPLQLQATVSGTAVRKVQVDFAGAEMQMGYNRPVLERQSGEGGRFSGQASLPVCTTGAMEWNATVLVDTGKAVVAVPFRFATGQR